MTYLTSDIFKNIPFIKHGFFTKQNGHSTGIYASLNMGKGSKDHPENITQNYEYVQEQLDIQKLQTLYQIHSNNVVTLTDNLVEPLPKADAMVTNQPHIALGILTADCGPLLLADPMNKVIGAAHMGRKGTLTGLLENTLIEMEKLGANRQSIIAVLGPTISKDNYEVGQDVFEEVKKHRPDYIHHLYKTDKTGKYLLDMHGLIQEICDNAHIQFENLNRCTYAEPELFYSYRHSTHLNQRDYGRLISVIALK